MSKLVFIKAFSRERVEVLKLNEFIVVFLFKVYKLIRVLQKIFGCQQDQEMWSRTKKSKV